MKKEPRKVFIFFENGYKTITYAELITMRDSDKSFSGNHFFIPVQGVLMEVSKAAYKEFYKDFERNRYLINLEKDYSVLSIDAFDNDDGNGTDFICDTYLEIEQTITGSLMIEKLNECLSKLTEEERLLIFRHYYQNISEVKLAKIYGITQQAISKRIAKIRSKLKKFIEN